jgi:hypothetical protein
LAQDTAKDWTRNVEAVVARHGHAQLSLNSVTQLRVASGLVVEVETSSEESSQHQPRLEERKYRAHLGAQSNSQLRSMGSLLVRYCFSRLAQTIQVATNGIARHFDSFFFRASVRDDAGQQRNRYLISGGVCRGGFPRFGLNLRRRLARDRQQDDGEIKDTATMLTSIASHVANPTHQHPL